MSDVFSGHCRPPAHHLSGFRFQINARARLLFFIGKLDILNSMSALAALSGIGLTDRGSCFELQTGQKSLAGRVGLMKLVLQFVSDLIDWYDNNAEDEGDEVAGSNGLF